MQAFIYTYESDKIGNLLKSSNRKAGKFFSILHRNNRKKLHLKTNEFEFSLNVVRFFILKIFYKIFNLS